MSYTIQPDGKYHIPIVALGERLRDNFGLRVREHEAFGGVSPVHAQNSYHDYGEAIDVTDWRDDNLGGVDWKTRTGNLENLLKGSGAEIFGPNSGVAGHDTHLHLAAKGGIFKLNQQQYDTLFGGNAGGKNATFGGFTAGSGTVDQKDDGATALQPSQPGETETVLKNTSAPEAKERAIKFVTRNKTAGESVKDFGNEFAKMESKRLGDALAGAQESIIQRRMDAGETFGTITEQQQ